jgi:hypothetical protein
MAKSEQLPDQAHVGNTPGYPVAIMNGYLTGKDNRRNPQTDADHAPREFRHYVDASGFQHVQLNNGLWKRRGAGLRGPLNFVNYLYAAYAYSPGAQRDNYGGFHKHGIDPLSYQQLVSDGPGSQPANPGGPRKIAADFFVNPGTC